MITVWLVHGTWARSATWCMKDSPLRAEIASKFGNFQLAFRVFEWSGLNSPFARHFAARKLRQAIRSKVAEEEPEARHWLIGHSHGGTVILKALEDESVRSHVNAVVCLSTPFIHANERPFSDIVALALVLPLSLPLLVWAALTSPIYVLLYAATCFAILFLWRYGSMRLLRLLSQEYAQSLPLLIVRSPADEPTAMFAGGHLVTRIIVSTLGTIPTLGGLALRTRGIVRPASVMLGIVLFAVLVLVIEGGLIALVSLVGVMRALEGGKYYDPRAELFDWSAAWLALPLLIFIIPGAMIFISGALFGCSVGVCSPYIEIIGEAAPPGRWTLFQLAQTRNPSLYELRHSAPYEHPEGLEMITTWLSNHAESADP